MSDSCPVLTAKSDASECLQEESDDAEDEEAFVFQTEESLYKEQERMQREHAEKETTKEILPPPQPATNSGRAKASRRSRRRYAPMLMTGGEGECGCGHDKEDVGRDEAEEEKLEYLTDSKSPPPPPKAVAAAGLAAVTATAAISAVPRPPKWNN